MRNSTYLSMGLLVAVVVWMLSGAFAKMPEQAQTEEPKKMLQKMKVRVLTVKAEQITREIVVQGELEPLRQVVVSAQTTSRVVALPIAKGEKVKTDTLLVQLAEEDRAAQLKRAIATVNNQKIEVAGARKLKQKGLQAENRVKAAEAGLATAEADLKRARLELDYTRIKAPF